MVLTIMAARICHACCKAVVAAHFGYWAAGLLQSDGAAADGCDMMRMPRSAGVPGGRLRPAAPFAGVPLLPPSCPLSSPTPVAAPAASATTRYHEQSATARHRCGFPPCWRRCMQLQRGCPMRFPTVCDAVQTFEQHRFSSATCWASAHVLNRTSANFDTGHA